MNREGEREREEKKKKREFFFFVFVADFFSLFLRLSIIFFNLKTQNAANTTRIRRAFPPLIYNFENVASRYKTLLPNPSTPSKQCPLLAASAAPSSLSTTKPAPE